MIYLYQLVQTLLQAVPQCGVSAELVAHLPVVARSFYSVLLPAASFLTRELRTCARASCRYDVENGTRSLARLVDSFKHFSRL